MFEFFKKYYLALVGLGLLVVILGWWFWPKDKEVYLSPEAPWIVIEKPLKKYTFSNLSQKVFNGSEIELEKELFKNDWYTAWLFSYIVEGKKVSGQLNRPSGSVPEGGWPVVIMIRGYVDREIFKTGVGTKNGADYFAKNGFITLAPDFLGFGESDMPPNNVFEERFLRPVQVLELIASVKNLKEVDPAKINIWGHSNGGQVALSVLEISGKDYPTSLWAPVSKPFPYSILYYTDEFDDYGKALRKVLSGLEVLYDVGDYSIVEFYNWIKASIQIHQGTNDEAVPLEWSQDLYKRLDDLDKEVELFIYSGADHNLVGGWDLAIKRSLSLFDD
ncbi:MAG: prolyl oligopeptidase family serine peptidase [Patescibacteria group bacterium]|nr:prolyl oligopeptidase family serine peptidase [Patescibacteria group bacterium]